MKEGFASDFFSIPEAYCKEKLSRCYTHLCIYSCETQKALFLLT